MVKKISLIFSIFILVFCLFTNSCDRNDLLGLFSSLDLDERLKEKDKFVLLGEDPSDGKYNLDPNLFNPALGDNYSFLLVTDTHLEEDKTHGLEKLVDVVTTDTKIRFVVITGDITQKGAEKEIDNFIKIAEDMGVPVIPVIGNHDFYFDNWKYWRDKIGSTMYRIDSDSTTLIILDSGNAFYGKSQLDWLEKQMGSTQKYVFVFSHSNLFVTDIYNMQQTTSTYERARIVNLLRNKCNIMFMGHTHKDQYNKVGGVDYVVLEGFIETKAYYIYTVNGSSITRTKHKL